MCPSCNKKTPKGAMFCPWCGMTPLPADKPSRRGKRGNGQGSVYKPSGATTYTAQVVLGYKKTEKGKAQPVYARKSGFVKKADAYAYLPQLTKKPANINQDITFKDLCDLWLPDYQRRERTKSTENCYKAAINHFKEIWYMRFADIGIDDLQECVDACPRGKQTRKNMKTFAGLLYDYAIPRKYIAGNADNLGRYLFPGGQPGAPREVFNDSEIELIKKSIGKVPYAEYIYCNIYLGFRPHELLSLDASKYIAKEKCFVGGEKTEAGTDRAVTVSPKIQKYIDVLLEGKAAGPVFCDELGKAIPLKKYREEYFYPALDAIGIDNPRVRENGPHRLTPHCCRHTFATLMKNVKAPDKDKLELIGHTSEEMLRHYQHTNFKDLRRITDKI